MSLKLGDLPPHLRAQVLEKAGGKPKPTKSRAGVGDGQACAGRCKCGERFNKATAWERHAKGAGPEHSRWVIDLGGRSSPDEPVPGFSSGEQAGDLRPDSSRGGGAHAP